MPKITIEVEVPTKMLAGLATGKYELAGSVVRHVNSKQVVAWLRGNVMVSHDPSLRSKLLASMLSAAGMKSATVAVIASSAIPLLDITIALYTLHRMQKRIQELKAKIDEIYDQIDLQFERDREINRRTAIEIAKLIPYVDTSEYRIQIVGEVVGRLTKAEEQLIWDIDSLLEGKNIYERSEQVQILTFLAFELSALSVCCFLEVDQRDAALFRLEQTIEKLKPRVQKIVRTLIGDHPALFFHPSISVEKEMLDRYIRIEEWLRGEKHVLLNVLRDNSKDLWNTDAIKSIVNKKGLPVENPFYLKTIPIAELLIEEFQRFVGYLAELESTDGTFVDSAQLTEDEAKQIEEHDDFMLLVDHEHFDRIERLSE